MRTLPTLRRSAPLPRRTAVAPFDAFFRVWSQPERARVELVCARGRSWPCPTASPVSRRAASMPPGSVPATGIHAGRAAPAGRGRAPSLRSCRPIAARPRPPASCGRHPACGRGSSRGIHAAGVCFRASRPVPLCAFRAGPLARPAVRPLWGLRPRASVPKDGRRPAARHLHASHEHPYNLPCCDILDTPSAREPSCPGAGVTNGCQHFSRAHRRC